MALIRFLTYKIYRLTIYRVVLAVFLLVVLSACQTIHTTRAGMVGVTRPQQMGIAREKIENQSANAYLKLKNEAAQKQLLNTDLALTTRVQEIAKRLIAQVGVYRSDAVSWQWEVNVFKNDAINAFCMAGGKIAVYTGLVQKLNLTDDELAAVIGHEIAHALREHVREQQTSRQIMDMAATFLGVLTGTDPNFYAQIGQLGYGLPHSRQAEEEADAIGLELAARAAYQPTAAVTLWQKMAGLSGGGRTLSFLSTHPSPQSRATDLARIAQLVDPLYQNALKAKQESQTNQLKR